MLVEEKGNGLSQVEADALTAEVVAEYLKDHPDFFVAASRACGSSIFPTLRLGCGVFGAHTNESPTSAH
ncbi:hypothetical protein VDIAB_80011 [Vibrio diabolicus]|nr:hypothetical protein VDIAB_80011 [Vibrio diabolicus]